MKLERMSVTNFRNFTSLAVEFDQQLTVFVGKNGCGKTALLDAAKIFLKAVANTAQGTWIDHKLDISNINVNTMNNNHVAVNNEKTCSGYATYSSAEIEEHIIKLVFEYQSGIGNAEKLAMNYEINNNELVIKSPPSPNTLSKNFFNFESLPLVVYYGAKRVLAEYRRNTDVPIDLKSAFTNAFNAIIDFTSTYTWFIERYIEQVMDRDETGDHGFVLPDLEAVRLAVAKVLEDYEKPIVSGTSKDIFVYPKGNRKKRLSLNQLSDGYRTMLALVMDMGRRMAVIQSQIKGTERGSVLETPGIVLIDEIELHLHPAWQQKVLPDLMRTFPNVQFIVSTHSPQVLSSIDSRHIRIIEDGGIIETPQGIWGAEVSRILDDVFGVELRSPSCAVDELERYSKMVHAGQWATHEAEELRAKLDERYGLNEPKLFELDMFIDNQKWEMETS